MNYFTEIATWILKCTFTAYHCVPPLRSPASLGILRWGNASDQKLEVGELRSPASYYTLTTAQKATFSIPSPIPAKISGCFPWSRSVMYYVGVRKKRTPQAT